LIFVPCEWHSKQRSLRMGRTLESKKAVSAAWVKTQKNDKKMGDKKIGPLHHAEGIAANSRWLSGATPPDGTRQRSAS
jgi:hypothetical protein